MLRNFTRVVIGILIANIYAVISGSIWALLVTGYSFSFTAFIGLTSLVGILVNNSIILVDYTNQLRQQGKDLISALKEAGESRCMPVTTETMGCYVVDVLRRQQR